MPGEAAHHSVSVAGVVIDEKGRTLVIQRRDNGHWEPPGGVLERDESIIEGLLREVKEETGLRIRAGGIIGRRVHPATGRTMVYMAARPTHGTDVFVGDPEELAEVRWVTADEADELMGGKVYDPVRDHLRRTLDAPTTEL